jgi:hypothetical protein
MREMEEAVWRKFLAARGRDWVKHELKTRPGMPNDPLLDVVFDEPLPSREFCGRWCAEQDNRMFSMSPTTIGIIVSAVMVVVFLTMAVSAVKSTPQDKPSNLADAPLPIGQASSQVDNTIPSQQQGSTASATRPPSSCAYMTYQTAACKTSGY